MINQVLEQYSAFPNCPENTLNEACRYSLLADGKRIRPILLLETYRLFQKNISPCIPWMVALEMIHNFSLIHDDLPAIDNDDIRHGKPSNHKKFGESTAILAGDKLLNYAYTVILNEKNLAIKDEKILQALTILNKATNSILAGEWIDIDCENKKIDQYLLTYMHQNKTGALINAAVTLGAILADASKDQLKKLERFANNIGLAFQIKDDILSEVGDPIQLGKPVGNDKKAKKSTYVTVFGLQQSEKILEQLITEAIQSLDDFANADFLRDLAIYIKEREK